MLSRETHTHRKVSTHAYACALAIFAIIALICFAPFKALNHDAYATQFLSKDGSAISANDAEQQAQQESGTQAQSNEPAYEAIAEGIPDGSYIGTGEGFKSTVMVQVDVKDGKITSITILSQADDPEYFSWAENIIGNIEKYQSTNVDAMTGATYSSRGIKAAVYDALKGGGAEDTTAMTIMTVSTWAIRIFAVLGAIGLIGCAIVGLRARSTKQRLSANRWQRLSAQLLFFAIAPSLFASGLMGIKSILSQVQAGAAVTLGSFFALLVLLIVFTIIFGRFFCGYACSFGFLNDILYQAGDAIFKKLHIKHPAIPRKVTKYLGYLKYIVLVAVCVIVLAGASQFLNDNSPWTAFSRLSSFTVKGITAASATVLALICIGMIFEKRFFCRFLCPLGAIFHVTPTIKRTGRVSWDRPQCYKGCDSCRTNCPVDIHPEGKLLAGECIACARCVEVCPADNIVASLQDARLPLAKAGGAGDEKTHGAGTSAASAREEDVVTDASTTATTGSARETETKTKDNASAPASSKSKAHKKTSILAGRTMPQVLRSQPVAVVIKALILLLALWIMGVVRVLPQLPFS